MIIIVDPPVAGQIWPCYADGHENLKNGYFYIRADGETRQAHGDEIHALLRRAKEVAPKANLSLDVIGKAASYTCDAEVLDDYLKHVREHLLAAIPKPEPEPDRRVAAASGLAGIMASSVFKNPAFADLFAKSQSPWTNPLFETTPDKRSYKQYESEISTWEKNCRDLLPDVLEELAQVVFPGVKIRVRNLGRTYLEGPEIHLHIEGDVYALDNDKSKRFNIKERLPKPPRRWMPVSNASAFANSVVMPASNYIMPHIAPSGPNCGSVSFRNGGSVDAAFKLDELRPARDFVTDDDFVLILRDSSITELHGTWTATVKGHNDVYEGEFRVSVDGKTRDFTKHVRQSLAARPKG